MLMIKIGHNLLHELVDKLQQSEVLQKFMQMSTEAVVKCVYGGRKMSPRISLRGLISCHYDLGLLCSYSICENRLLLKAAECGA